jgi:hypothetical protein
MRIFSSPVLRAVSAFALVCGTVAAAEAQRGGRGGTNGGGSARASHQTSGRHHASSANRGVHHSGSANRGASTNRNTNVNRSGNVNNVNVNRNVNVSGNGYRGGHPVARGAAIGAMALTTGAIVGSMYHTLPSSCVTVVQVGLTYYQCGSAWYQSQGGEYVVVTQP